MKMQPDYVRSARCSPFDLLATVVHLAPQDEWRSLIYIDHAVIDRDAAWTQVRPCFAHI